jgi:RNA-binding protein
MNLSNKQKQYLKGLAHSLKPVIQLGNNGLTEGVLAETEVALNHHELIKVKIPTDDREEKQLIMDAIVRETNAVKVQTVGHILVIYRPSEDKKISIPSK